MSVFMQQAMSMGQDDDDPDIEFMMLQKMQEFIQLAQMKVAAKKKAKKDW